MYCITFYGGEGRGGGESFRWGRGFAVCFRRGRCWHRPGNLAAAEGPKRRAKTPALHCGREREVIRKRQLFARPVGGPMQASAPTQGQAAAPGSVTRVHYIVGRAFTPAGEGCEGGTVVLCKRRTAGPGRSEANREGIGKVMCRTPQSADADSSPYRGAFWVEAVCEASPARGGGCAERRRRRGALPVGGGDILQNSAGHCPASAGDDAGIIPEPCGGGRPQAAGENARPTLRPGAGGDTKAAALCQARRRADASIGPYAGDGPPRSAPRCGDMLP